MAWGQRSGWGLAALFIAALAALAATGCGNVQVTSRPQVPFTATQMTAAQVTPRASWLEVTLLSPDFNRVFYFRASDVCKALIVEGQDVEYRRTGGYGYVQRGAVRCDVAGIGSLGRWRDSFGRPTRGMAPGKPRQRSDFKEVYRDDDVVMVRGKFLVAAYIKWPGPDDTIAVFENSPECGPVLSRGMGFTEYDPNASNPIVLVQQGGNCPMRGLIRPE